METNKNKLIIKTNTEMKNIITAIEFMRIKSNKRKMKEMEDLKNLLIESSNGMLIEDSFDIGYMSETDMLIKIRDVYFDIDGMDLQSWLNVNCITKHESDKWITIESLR